LTIAELACRVPKSGAHYAYLTEGLGNWVGFLFVWNGLLIQV
jgi:amino acid transporter